MHQHDSKIVGNFLYYGIAIDNTILPALNYIVAEQSILTTNIAKKVAKLLNYFATNPSVQIQYHVSGMVLHMNIDTSYLSVNKARSRVSGIFFLVDTVPNNQDMENYESLMNTIAHVVCKIIKNIMASAVEAELGAIFICGQDAVPTRSTLIELGHPHTRTPLQVENSTAVGITNHTIKQRQSKEMGMRFYWVTDRINKGKFIIYWRP